MSHDAIAFKVRQLLHDWRAKGYQQGRGWLSSMEVDSCYEAGNLLVLAFTDRHGQRFAWGWATYAKDRADPDWLTMLAGDLIDDLENGGLSKPDSEGTRWLLHEGTSREPS
jgi:hypothetical protein